jgi:hypothetical protein
MTETERLLTEIRDLERKVADTGRPEGARNSSDRRRSDLQMLEQQLLALRQRLDHTPHGRGSSPVGEPPTDRMERKLDSALSDSFPGSDAVSFLQPAPNKPTGSR